MNAQTPRQHSTACTVAQLGEALPGALRKLDPRELLGAPVHAGRRDRRRGHHGDGGRSTRRCLACLVTVWLWLTVLFGTLAESVAEGRGKAQAASLRALQQETTARRVARRATSCDTGNLADAAHRGGRRARLRAGDVVVVEAGERIPGDGDVIEGVATVDESAVTGESAPVIRESGGDRCAVTGGTVVLSDRIVVRITSEPGPLVRGPDDRAGGGLRAAADPQRGRPQRAADRPDGDLRGRRARRCTRSRTTATPTSRSLVLTALLVCLIPTTIGALLSAIGIAGMDRLVRRNVLAMSGRAVEAAGDVDVLLLDKTGTITYGNRRATELLPLDGVTAGRVAEASLLSSLADETPGGPQHRRPGPRAGPAEDAQRARRRRRWSSSPRRPG